MDKEVTIEQRCDYEDEGIVSDIKRAQESDVSLEDVEDVADPLEAVVAGLQTSNEVQIPLRSVHVKAKLVDLAAEVVVFQEYVNDGRESIEAKYVFPLNDSAAVCGFEAFINGKHVVGEVKEKQQAHKEYKEAVSQGHGAYLMDEEKPDVFTISVGNLPASASVLIKITYVAELSLDGEMINFFLPGSVAPWRRNDALDNSLKTELTRVDILSAEASFSLQVAVDMPFRIKELNSPTHVVKMKRTDTKAVLSLESNIGLGDGFQLLISLAEIHVPRMWTEECPENSEEQACMLTFFPEFEESAVDDLEIILLVDASNSMEPSCESTKKAAMLILSKLPQGCRFNIISFGASFSQLFPNCQPVTARRVSEACSFVKKIRANKGGTDVWRVLKKLQLLANCERVHPLNLFLLSDGHISEEVFTMAAIQRSAKAMRWFTFGFGRTGNLHLLKRLACIGAGAFEFLDSKLKSTWERKAKEQLRKSQQPAITSVKVTWQQCDDDARKPLQVRYSQQK